MTIVDQVVEKLRNLSSEKQQEVLSFTESLRGENATKPPSHSLRGLWKNLNIDITEQEIAEARREMWGNFPRDNS